MLGMTIKDPFNVEHGGEVSGLGLLDGNTIFEKEKTRTRVNGKLPKVTGIFSNLSDVEYEGYEIHMGATTEDNVIVNKGNVYGSYIHGIFDSEGVSKSIIEALLESKGLSYDKIKTFNISDYKEEQYDILAKEVRKSLDLDYIYKIIN